MLVGGCVAQGLTTLLDVAGATDCLAGYGVILLGGLVVTLSTEFWITTSPPSSIRKQPVWSRHNSDSM